MMRASLSRSSFLPAASTAMVVAPWVKSTLLVASLHAGIAGLATARLLPAAPDNNLAGAELVVEFAALTTSAETEFAPETQDRNAEDKPALPHLDESLSEKRESDLPTEQASPATPEDDALKLAQERTRKESDTPNEMQATEAMAEQKQDLASRASTASDSAPEQRGKPEAAVQAAPEEGNAAEAQRQVEAWQRRIFSHIARHKRYPEAARPKRLTGETLVAFRLDAAGQVQDLRVVRPSGAEILDLAALEVLRKASPLPPPPASVQVSAMEFTIPLRFSAKSP